MDWSRENTTVGAAWIVKNDSGRVLQHSRRAFSAVSTVIKAKMMVFMWALESMQSLRYQSVVFSSSFVDLGEAVARPTAWPSLHFEVSESGKS